MTAPDHNQPPQAALELAWLGRACIGTFAEARDEFSGRSL